MCVETKGVGEKGSGDPCPALSMGGGAQVGLCPPPTFRHRATQLGTDCQTKSAFLLPIWMLAITVYTELCVNKPNYNLFNTCIVTHVD